MKTYRDKVAVVTGASSGIGRELAIALARRGARLALSARNEEELGITRVLCEQAGAKDVRTYRVDVSKRGEVFAHAEAVKRDFGAAHFVFNNAGVALATTVAATSIEEFEWLLGVNLWGVIYGSKAFLPIFLEQREGHVVNICSGFGLVGVYAQGPYNVSKFGVRGFTECLWSELEGTGVGVTLVHPGGTRTNMEKAAPAPRAGDERAGRVMRAIEKGMSSPADACARDILDGVARGKRRVLTGNGVRMMDFLARLFPQRYPEILHWALGA